MMPRSKKLPGSGTKNTSMRNVRSTCESMAQHTSPNSSRAPRDVDEYPAITVDLSEWSAIPKLTRDQRRGLLALRAGPAYDSKLLFSADSHQWFPLRQ